MLNNLKLISAVTAIYEKSDGVVTNEDLYAQMEKFGLNVKSSDKQDIAGDTHNLAKRKLRWIQQTLKEAGIIEKVDGRRGVWQFLHKNKEGLHEISPGYSVLAFSTLYGAAILATAESFFGNKKFKMPVHLILSSPPYPLNIPRKYGNVAESEYVDWLCKTIEPVIDRLEEGGSICLNLGNDVFIKNSPQRSMYVERVSLALHDRFGLAKMDNLIWQNTTRPPGPFQWASKQRFQLNAQYENILWFCRSPEKCFADNRRVLQPHSEAHIKFMQSGGNKKYRSNGDGSHVVMVGAYGNMTDGKIPKNILPMAHRCKDQMAYKRYCASLGLQTHGAAMPLRLATFLVEYMTSIGQTVVDPFGGSFTTAKASELLKRLWYSTEMIYEYAYGASSRFVDADGYENYLEKHGLAA